MNNERLEQAGEDDLVREVAEMLPAKLLNLKMKINNLLWEEMPCKTPLSVMEDTACEIFDKITDIAQKVNMCQR